MAKVMIHMHNNPMQFWVEGINIAYYTAKRILKSVIKKTSYELWIERKPNLKYFRTFGMNAIYSRIGRTLGSLRLNLM